MLCKGKGLLSDSLFQHQPTTMAATKEVPETMTVDLGALLDAGDGAMVTLVAGETHLAAHRAVLEARSPVFEAMFRHDTAEASSSQVIIPDVEGPVLRQLLAYCYTLRAPKMASMAHHLLAAADKYGMTSLKLECEQQVSAQLTVENAAAAAVLAVRHSCSRLREAAIAFVKDNTHQVMATQGWADAVLKQPKDIVEVSRLLTENPAETSVPATTESKPISQAQLRSKGSRTRIPCAPPAACRHMPPLDFATLTRVLRLSREEKARRLIQAAKEGAVEEVRALLAVRADVEARDGERSTALHWAAARGHEDVVWCLIQAGAEVNVRDCWDNTPLLYAADGGHAAVVRLLAASSADPNARGASGRTPLHWAAERGHREAAVALLEAGADRRPRDDSRDTPFHLAMQNNHQQLAEMLEESLES